MSKMFIRSKCCLGNWQLEMQDGNKFRLLCEKCGKDIGPSVKVTGPQIEEKCACCAGAHHE